MPVNPSEVLKKYDRLKQEHTLNCPLWQDLADFIHPRRGSFIVKRSPGTKQTDKLFDSTALDSHDRLASTLNGTLTSRASAWFSLKMRDEQLNEDTSIKTWLEDCTKRMFQAFNQSNFAQEIHEVYLDEPAFGTSGIFVEERDPSKKDFAGLVFTAIPLQQLVIDEDKEGRVNSVYREFEMSAGACVEKWGIDKVGEKIAQSFTEGKSDVLFKILHVTRPRTVGASQEPKLGTPKTKLPWASVHIAMKDKTLIAEGGFHEFPFMVPRWSKTTGERYGRGPGHLALPDVKTLNKVKELGLKTWGKTLDMPTKSLDDGVVGPIRNYPGGNTVVRSIEGLQPLYPPGMFREAIGNDQIKTADLQAAIKRYFFVDQMQLPEKSYMTAFEVSKQFELLQRLLGPTMGRQESELLSPLIDRVFGIMFRHNALPKVPPILAQNGANLDVQYEGPLAKSQRLAEVEGMERLLQFVIQAQPVDPEIADNINWDEAITTAADVLGVPERLLNDPENIKKVRDARAKQQAQQQQLADVHTVAAAAGKAAPALKLLPGGDTGGAATA
jgi:hypothetical protein